MTFSADQKKDLRFVFILAFCTVVFLLLDFLAFPGVVFRLPEMSFPASMGHYFYAAASFMIYTSLLHLFRGLSNLEIKRGLLPGVLCRFSIIVSAVWILILTGITSEYHLWMLHVLLVIQTIQEAVIYLFFKRDKTDTNEAEGLNRNENLVGLVVWIFGVLLIGFAVSGTWKTNNATVNAFDENGYFLSLPWGADRSQVLDKLAEQGVNTDTLEKEGNATISLNEMLVETYLGQGTNVKLYFSGEKLSQVDITYVTYSFAGRGGAAQMGSAEGLFSTYRKGFQKKYGKPEVYLSDQAIWNVSGTSLEMKLNSSILEIFAKPASN